MRILIAPGAFKHSLGAGEASEAIARGLSQALPDATLIKLPIADGGNGTLDAWLAQGGQRINLTVNDPLMRPIQAEYGILPDGKTAIIEMAIASGIELLTTAERNPLKATTYGTGELLQHALEQGARRFIIGMGGSATVDGGSGAIRALGVQLLDSHGNEIAHGGGYLTDIATIDASNLDARWKDCEIIIASDVENKLLGETGASAVFGPQKGASDEDVITLEGNLAHFANVIAEQHGTDIRDVVGTGAAGGLSAGLMAFIGGEIRSGIDLLFEYNHFEDTLKTVDLVITGEGQMDEQTVYGKGPIGVARLARSHGIPTIALVGGLNVHESILHEAGITSAFSIVDKPMSLDDALSNANELLKRESLRVGYMLGIWQTKTVIYDVTQVAFEILIDSRITSIKMISNRTPIEERHYRLGLHEMSSSLVDYLSEERDLLVGIPTAERIISEIGSALPNSENLIAKPITYSVKGRNLTNGLPDNIEISSDEVRHAIQPIIIDLCTLIVDKIRQLISLCPTNVLVDRQISLQTMSMAFHGMQGYFELTRLDERLQESIRAELIQDAIVEYIPKDSSE